ncbi:MAG TPA: pyridoxamine 5'-phosphate oxidase family protein [Streptosporangiaceae bacterium]|jgi:nitroimidazol reductase NimA-like FMN-containing flavoprotein (pyridoxamine 5'-phosphate oxidase superfamily)
MSGYPGDDAVLTRAQCLNLLRNTLVGRVVYTRGALPAVTPVGYVLDGEYIVLRTAPGSRLDRGVRDAVVAFEIDHVDPDSPDGWSVVVVGRSARATDDRTLRRLRALPLAGKCTDHYVRIGCQRVTGRILSAYVRS